MNTNSRSLQDLTGVGDSIVRRLIRLGIKKPRDLLLHLPHRYQDRTRVTPIGELQLGEDFLVVGKIEVAEIRYGRRKNLVVQMRDASGTMWVRFYHFRPAQQHSFVADKWIHCYGRCVNGAYGYEMIHPEYRLHSERPAVATDALTPIYPTTDGISLNLIRNLVRQALQLELDEIDDHLPAAVRKKFALMELKDALKFMHQPPPGVDLDALKNGAHPAQQRLALEELLAHHLALAKLRDKHQTQRAAKFIHSESWDKLHANLNFKLTGAQNKVIGEILSDLKRARPTMRLLQGDVGSGKTVVAAAAALTAIDCGYQVAIMAPTELLANQHHKTFAEWLMPLHIKNEILTSKMSAALRKQVLHNIKTGVAKLIIGTHALFQDKVDFAKLGLLIIDEQHRFGVGQRLALRNKSADDKNFVPHQLIMSATPIPRSLAMIFYADLDVSTLDESPPGRKAVKTVAMPNTRRSEIITRIENLCANKNQVYWVCPLITESDKLQAEAAEDTYAKLKTMLPNLTIGLIHGRMKAAEKDAVMQQFHRRKIDLLVATTVIEVGVDVPAATLMVIENAERLGLAQLHQLRGRVGRGGKQATCVLMYQPPLGKLSRERIGILRETNDGFKIANYDLQQRGPGDFLGTRQTGLMQMRIANLTRDRALLAQVERIASELKSHHRDSINKIIARWIDTRTDYAKV